MLHFHNMLPMPAGIGFVQRRLASSTTAALAVSEAVQAWAIGQFGLPDERVEVLYNSFDATPFASPRGERSILHPERRAGDRADRPVRCGVQGQDVMIRALPQIRARCPGAVLLLVGEGPDRSACERLTASLSLDDAVVFTGHRSDIAEILAAVDVVVMPTMLEEAFGYAAPEAGAAGRPVVCFDSGGLPEVIEHGLSGLVVGKGDEDALAGAIGQLLADPGLARRPGDHGRRRAGRFSTEHHVERLQAIYRQIARDQGAGG